jgi:hypothetical protein
MTMLSLFCAPSLLEVSIICPPITTLVLNAVQFQFNTALRSLFYATSNNNMARARILDLMTIEPLSSGM